MVRNSSFQSKHYLEMSLKRRLTKSILNEGKSSEIFLAIGVQCNKLVNVKVLFSI